MKIINISLFLTFRRLNLSNDDPQLEGEIQLSAPIQCLKNYDMPFGVEISHQWFSEINNEGIARFFIKQSLSKVRKFCIFPFLKNSFFINFSNFDLKNIVSHGPHDFGCVASH